MLLTAVLAGFFSAQIPWGAFGIMMSAGVGVGIFILLVLQKPAIALHVLLLYIWLVAGRADPGDLLEAYPFVRWGSYILIPVFTGLVLSRIVTRGYWRKSLVEPYIALIAGLILLSGFVNNTGFAAVAYSIGIYLRYPILFLILVNLNLGELDYKRALRLFLIITLLLVGEAILNYILLGKRDDGTFFTVGVSHGHVTAGMFFIYGFCFVIAQILREKGRFYHIFHVLVVALIFIAAWIASIRLIMITAPLLFILLQAVNRRFLRRSLVMLLAIIILVLILIAIFMPWWHQLATLIPYDFNISYRFDVVKRVVHTLVSSNKLVFGFGPRSFSPGSIGPPGEMFEIMLAFFGRHTLGTLNQFTTTFSELGLVGFAVYWIMLMLVLRMNLRFLYISIEYKRYSGDTKAVWTIVSLAFVGIWFYYAVLGIVFYDTWRIDLSSLVFWVCAAAIYSEGRRRGYFNKKVLK